MKVSSSAPGKVILFGEHAVVYNVTAVAAALSNLRIYVDVSVDAAVGGAALEVMLHDIKGENGQAPYCKRIALADVRGMFTQAPSPADAYEAVNPDEAAIARLRAGVDETGNANAAQCLMAICYLLGCILPEYLWADEAKLNVSPSCTMKLEIRSIGLPIGAGLGSSAAFSVALSGALLRARFLAVREEPPYRQDAIADAAEGVVPPAELLPILNKWAYAAEVVIHGAPSGLDNTTSCFGGAVKFKRDAGTFDVIPQLPSLDILLTNTRVPRSTKLLVAGVRVLHDKMPAVVQPILASIEAISQRFLQIVECDGEGEQGSDSAQGDVGELMDVNHELLNALGVGHPSLTAVRDLSRAHGCSSKLTGAGGGGCAITLLPRGREDTAERLAQALQQAGFETFQSSIGGRGVKWHS